MPMTNRTRVAAAEAALDAFTSAIRAKTALSPSEGGRVPQHERIQA